MEIRNYADVKVYINTKDILKENVVYKLTFPNGKVYIGQTVQKLKNRLCGHCNESFTRKDSAFNTIKSRAIRKYMTFEVEVLYQGEDLDYNEIEYIKYYNATNREFGYNLESGGCLNKIVSEETKLKMSKAQKGKKLSEETKNKMSGTNNHRARSIIVTEIKTGIETRFNTIKEATELYGVLQPTISQVIAGKAKTFKNKQYTARYE